MIVRVFSMLAALSLLPLLPACSPAPSPQEQTENRERELMTPLKTKYPDAVVGFDFHGTSVDVSIDPNGMIAMGEDDEAAMKAAALQRWKGAWTQTHPRAHATLQVRLIDFRGTPYYKTSAKV